MAHIRLMERRYIQEAIENGCSATKIASDLQCSHTTIIREVKRNLKKTGSGWSRHHKAKCLHRQTCSKPNVECTPRCKEFKQQLCSKLKRFPYVCNACKKRVGCKSPFKRKYEADYAQKIYRERIKDSQRGIIVTKNNFDLIDSVVYKGLSNGKSINNIVENNDAITVSKTTIYRWIWGGLLKSKVIDFPIGPNRQKPKKAFRRPFFNKSKVGKEYSDYLNTPRFNGSWEMDTVKGKRETESILTLIETNTSFFLAFPLERNDAKSVSNVFRDIRKEIGNELFKDVFKVILTDNGPEFSNPKAIEFCEETGEKLTSIYFCDSYSSWQKGKIENVHKLLRRYLPKGKSIKGITKEKLILICNHINSYERKKLSNKKPYDCFDQSYGKDFIRKLKLERVENSDLILKQKLIK